jgi:L-ascorbate metabolism protein UlaG (beta-lactamase superfamily)
MTHRAKILLSCLAIGVGVFATGARAAEPACSSLTPAIVGGPVPGKSSDIAVLRWLGNANYEIDYRGQVFLFDTYFDRTARNHDLGFKVSDIKRADAIFVSHAHFDHMADVVPVAAQTHAKVVGAPLTIETAVKLGLPASQAITVTGGETLNFGDVSAEIALARHSTIQAGLTDALGALYKIDSRPNTPEETAHNKEVQSRGTFAPDVIDKGTLAYGLVFKNGFKTVLVGSAGPITDGDRTLAQKFGRADIAIIAYQPHPVAEHQVEDTFPLVKLFNPRLYLPAHHDASFGTWLDLGLEPLFMKLRDEMPGTKFAAPLYRSPICIATSGPKRGEIVSLRY